MRLREGCVVQESMKKPFDRCRCLLMSSCREIVRTVLQSLFVAVCIPQLIRSFVLILLWDGSQDGTGRVHLAHLPKRHQEGRGHRCLDPPMAIGDDQLNPLRPRSFRSSLNPDQNASFSKSSIVAPRITHHRKHRRSRGVLSRHTWGRHGRCSTRRQERYRIGCSMDRRRNSGTSRSRYFWRYERPRTEKNDRFAGER